MTEVPIIQKPVHWFAEQINGLIDLQSKSMDWFLYDRDLLHEGVNNIWHLMNQEKLGKDFASINKRNFSVPLTLIIKLDKSYM